MSWKWSLTSFPCVKAGSPKTITWQLMLTYLATIWNLLQLSLNQEAAYYTFNYYTHYQLRNDLYIHSPKQLESFFIVVSFVNTQNQIIGTIYKHLSMNASIISFNNDYLKTVLNKIPNYSKNILLKGDFNVNLNNINKEEAHATF